MVKQNDEMKKVMKLRIVMKRRKEEVLELRKMLSKVQQVDLLLIAC